MAVRGPLKGHVIPLPPGEYWVGRQNSNDLQLEDNAVSRRHCLFIRSGEACTLKDLDSRNGTFVTGTPVTEQQLEPGDEIRIGGSVFCYLVDANAGLPPGKQASVSSTRELRLEEAALPRGAREDHARHAHVREASHLIRGERLARNLDERLRTSARSVTEPVVSSTDTSANCIRPGSW